MSTVNMPMKSNVIEEMQINSAMFRRTIYLQEDVNDESAFKVIYFLNKIREKDKKRGDGKKDDITLVIDSRGGSILAGLSIIGLIESMIEEGYNIISITTKFNFSMGSAISQICSTRLAYRYATFLYHQPSSFTGGTLGDMETSVKETQRMWDLMKKITMKYTNFTEAQLDEIKMKKEDLYLSTEEALKYGIIDRII